MQTIASLQIRPNFIQIIPRWQALLKGGMAFRPNKKGRKKVHKNTKKKNAANYQKTQLHNQREVFALLIVFLIVATIFLLLSNYWSFIPIRKITDELQLLFDSKIKKLSSSYPADLLELTKTINTLIEINASKQKS